MPACDARAIHAPDMQFPVTPDRHSRSRSPRVRRAQETQDECQDEEDPEGCQLYGDELQDVAESQGSEPWASDDSDDEACIFDESPLPPPVPEQNRMMQGDKPFLIQA